MTPPAPKAPSLHALCTNSCVHLLLVYAVTAQNLSSSSVVTPGAVLFQNSSSSSLSDFTEKQPLSVGPRLDTQTERKKEEAFHMLIGKKCACVHATLYI